MILKRRHDGSVDHIRTILDNHPSPVYLCTTMLFHFLVSCFARTKPGPWKRKAEVFAGWIYLLSTSDVNMEELGLTNIRTVFLVFWPIPEQFLGTWIITGQLLRLQSFALTSCVHCTCLDEGGWKPFEGEFDHHSELKRKKMLFFALRVLRLMLRVLKKNTLQRYPLWKVGFRKYLSFIKGADDQSMCSLVSTKFSSLT